MDKKAEERHKDQLETIKGIHKKELLYFGLGVTLAILVVTVIGAAIEARWIPKWFGIG